MVYADQFSLSTLHNLQKNMIDETWWRIYFSNCKTLLTTRAGLHHRRTIFFRNVLIFLSCYPCSHSLLPTETLPKPSPIDQSINLGGFFSLRNLHNILTPDFSFEPWRENKRGSCSCFQLFANEFVCWYHRLHCLCFRMLAHSINVLVQQSFQILLRPFLFACQKKYQQASKD